MQDQAGGNFGVTYKTFFFKGEDSLFLEGFGFPPDPTSVISSFSPPLRHSV